MSGRAVTAAYQDTGAAVINCTHCRAEIGEPCTKPDGRVSKVPCIARIAAADLTPGLPSVVATVSALDYSEPRNAQETT